MSELAENVIVEARKGLTLAAKFAHFELRDAQRPRQEVGAHFELIELLPQQRERLLVQVLGVFRPPHHGAQKAKNLALMIRDEFDEFGLARCIHERRAG